MDQANGSLRTGKQAGRRLFQESRAHLLQRASAKPTAKWHYEMSLMPPWYLHIPQSRQENKLSKYVLASIDKEALYSFRYSQTLHRICHVHICWMAKRGKPMFTLVWVRISLVWNLVWAKCLWDTWLCPPRTMAHTCLAVRREHLNYKQKFYKLRLRRLLKVLCKS